MYDFKVAQEIGWAVLVAVAVQVAQILMTAQIETITDWRTWALSLFAACVRAGAAAFLAKITQPKAVGE